MALNSNFTTTLLILTVLLVLLPQETYAFGAGDIPDFAYLNDKAFRHGDIENILESLAKNVGGPMIGGGSLLGIASSVFKAATGGSKFSKSDVKKVYFGNWLRDYSQAMDIAGLSKLSSDTIVLIIAVLGFMTFGFATEEFEVTQDRLGVYLPVEHIDNPRGYAEKEGDARQFNPKLRPPVDPRELEIDPQTGMKNYMATENQGWDTSTAFIRRTLKACIEHGRQAGGQENSGLWEAYRLLGTGLHTLEDLLAHSNWCEIALRKMGHEEVFCHVGDNVMIDTPNGPAPPLVTGTFGGADFLHSLLGEAGDKLSQASVTDLSNKMSQASQSGDSNISTFKAVLGKLPVGGNEEKMDQSEEMSNKAKAYQFNPDNVAPPEVQQQLWDLLKWRDGVMRDILKAIEMVPGLDNLVDEFTNALNAYVYTILAPYLVPLITQVSGVLDEGSAAVISNEDQYEVFDNPDASDPSHSLLSKDHFGLILNEPAGKIAQIMVQYAVDLIVKAWSDDSDPDSVLDRILEAFHHPYYATGRSEIQNKMFQHMEMWIGGLGSDMAGQVIQALTKESVRNHRNKRIGSEDMSFEEPGYQHSTSSNQPKRTGYQQPTSQYQGSDNYGRGDKTYSGGGYTAGTYSGGGRSGYGDAQPSEGRYQSNRNQGQSYDNAGYGSGGLESGSQRRQDDDNRHGGGYPQTQQQSYGQGRDNQEGYGRRRDDDQSYGTGYESGRTQTYTSGQGSEYSTSYSQPRASESYDGGSHDSGRSRNEGYGGGSYSQGDRKRYDDNESYNTERRRNEGGESYGSGGYTRTTESYESGNSGYGRSDTYGSQASSRRDDESDSHRTRGSSGYAPSYERSGNNEYRSETSEGYGGSGGGYSLRGSGSDAYRSHESSGHSAGYGRSGENEYRSETSYVRRDDDDDKRTYGQGESYGNRPSYSAGYGGDETYGAERLNIRDDDDDDDSHKRNKHHQHKGHHRDGSD